jgi:hypothetical protein
MIMTDYEYILQQARKSHYSKWSDEELRKCVDKLVGLSHQELTALYTSKWIKDEKVLKQEIFKQMFIDKIGKREERIKNLPTDELIEEFKDKKSGNVSLIRTELKNRYKENVGEDRIKVTLAFNESSKGDQLWIENQMRKELYGEQKKD